MIALNGTTQSLTIVLAGAPATTQPAVIASWADVGGTPDGSALATNGTTAVTAVPAPAASVLRIVRSLSIYNRDTASVVVTISKAISATSWTLAKVTLAAGYTLSYTDDGWQVIDTNGGIVASGGGSGGIAWGSITGTLSAQTDLQTALNAKGALGIPQNSKSAAYTLVLGDNGYHIYHPSADTTARTWTIPANSSVALPVGAAVTFINDNAAGVITIAITTDTMRLAGAGTTGSRTLAANGVATAIKVTSTSWQISGSGLT